MDWKNIGVVLFLLLAATAVVAVSDLGPDWRNLSDNVTGELSTGETVNISVEVRDNDSGLFQTVLSVNDTGTWRNATPWQYEETGLSASWATEPYDTHYDSYNCGSNLYVLGNVSYTPFEVVREYNPDTAAYTGNNFTVAQFARGITQDELCNWYVLNSDSFIYKYTEQGGAEGYTGENVNISHIVSNPQDITHVANGEYFLIVDDADDGQYVYNISFETGQQVSNYSLMDVPDEFPRDLKQNRWGDYYLNGIGNDSVYVLDEDLSWYEGASYKVLSEDATMRGMSLSDDRYWLLGQDSEFVYRYTPNLFHSPRYFHNVSGRWVDDWHSWKNNLFDSGTLGYRIHMEDAVGNWNVTDTGNIPSETGFSPNPESDNWFNQDWTYRKELQVSEQQGHNTSQYIARYNGFVHGGNASEGCADIRVTSNQTEPTEYAITNCGSDTVDIRFNVSFIDSSETLTYYVYYGNPDAENRGGNWDTFRNIIDSGYEPYQTGVPPDKYPAVNLTPFEVTTSQAVQGQKSLFIGPPGSTGQKWASYRPVPQRHPSWINLSIREGGSSVHPNEDYQMFFGSNNFTGDTREHAGLFGIGPGMGTDRFCDTNEAAGIILDTGLNYCGLQNDGDTRIDGTQTGDTWYRLAFEMDWTNQEFDIWLDGNALTAGDYTNVPFNLDNSEPTWTFLGVSVLAEEDAVEGQSAWFDNLTFTHDISTTESSANQRPELVNATTEPEDIGFGESVSVVANASDPDGSISSVVVSVWENGTLIVDEQALSDPDTDGKYRASDVFTASSQPATYDFKVEADDTDGGAATATFQRIAGPRPTVELVSPINGDSATSPVPFQYRTNSTYPLDRAELWYNGSTTQSRSSTVQTEQEFVDNGTFTGTSVRTGNSEGTLRIGYQNGTTCTDGLVGMYRFDQSSGGITDYSGCGNDGTNNGTTRGVTGVFDTDAVNVSQQDTGVVVDSPEMSMDENSMTVSAWVKPNIDYPDDVVGNELYFVGMREGRQFELGFSTYSDQWYFKVFDSLGNQYQVNAEQGEQGEWYHLVGVLDGDDMRFYVNGELRETLSGNDQSFDNNLQSGTDVNIGGRPGTGVPERSFNGVIDEFQLYNTSLTTDEVEDLYFNGPTFTGEYTAAYQFDSRQQWDSIDVSTDLNTGTNITLTVDAISGGEIIDSEEYDVPHGFTSIGLDAVDVSDDLNVTFTGQSSDASRSWSVEGFTLNRGEFVDSWEAFETNFTVTNNSLNRIIETFELYALPIEAEWNVRVYNSIGKSSFASMNQSARIESDPDIDDLTVYNDTLNGEGRINQGGTARIRATVSDLQDRDIPRVTITNPDGTDEVVKGSMTLIQEDPAFEVWEYVYTPENEVDSSGRWNVTVSIEESPPQPVTASEQFIYQKFNVIEGVPIQGEAEVDMNTSFTEDLVVENPTGIRFEDATAVFGIPPDTVSENDVELVTDAGVQHPIDTVDLSASNIVFTIGSQGGGVNTQWRLRYNTSAPESSTRSFTRINQGIRQFVREYNVSGVQTELSDVLANTSIPEPGNVTQVALFSEGQDITDESAYSVQVADDYSWIAWRIPSLDSDGAEFEVVVDRGEPINRTESLVIKNLPVEEAKNIRWRRCIRLDNRNDFSVTFNEKIRVPSSAQDVRVQQGCPFTYIEGNTDAVETRLDDVGDYVPFTRTLEANRNSTYAFWYQTDSISVSAPRRNQPNLFFAGEDAPFSMRISVLGQSPHDVVTEENVTLNVPISYGNDVRVFEDGSRISSLGTVDDGYLFNISNVSQGQTRRFRFNYTVPTANVTEVFSGKSEAGNELKRYRVLSVAPRTLEPARLYLEDIAYPEIINVSRVDYEGEALVFQEELDVIQGRTEQIASRSIDSSQVVLGSLPPESSAEPIIVSVEYRQYDRVLGVSVATIRSETGTFVGLLGVLQLLLSTGYIVVRRYGSV